MPAFHYHAIDDKGKSRKGVLEGDSAKMVRQQLRELSLIPLEVTAIERDSITVNRSPQQTRRGKLSASELALATRQLATLIQAGLPVEQALGAVANQNENVRTRHILSALRARVMEGHSLAAALADFPRAFPELYRATVEAGEQSGFLGPVLERLADYTEARQQLQGTILKAIIYPVTLTIVAFSVVIGLLTYVVPQVVQVFETGKQKLPALTTGLIALSDFLKSYGWILALLIVAGMMGLRILLKDPRVRYRFHAFYLTLPLVKRLIRGIESARFMRTFSILVGSGVPILQALHISGAVLSNLPMREAVLRAAVRVSEGASIAHAMDESKRFPPMVIQLIASGEASGRLDQMLERAAISQEREAQTLIAILLSLFEPLLILTMGAVVLVIVLAILLPIFELNQLVK